MSSKKLVLDLVNAKNPLPKELDLELANVMGVVLDPENEAWVSTTIVPMPSTFYEEAVEVEYNRVNLTKMFQARDENHNLVTHIPRVVGPHAGDLHNMINWISKEIGIPLTMEDVENKDFSFLKEFEETNVPLVARDTSLLYYGQAVIHYLRRRMNLDEVIRNTSVNEIRKPYVTEEGWEGEKASVTAATWPVDFTEHYEKIKRHENHNIAANGAALSKLMDDLFGFKSWPTGWTQTVRDYPTDVIEDANHNYDRVVIQEFRDLSTNKTRPYEGPAYFHYNIMDLDI